MIPPSEIVVSVMIQGVEKQGEVNAAKLLAL